MVKAEDIVQIIKECFLKNDRGFPLKIDTDLLQEGICDSLKLVTLAVEVESRYKPLKILDQEIKRDNFSSAEKILNFLKVKGLEVEDAEDFK